MASIDNKHTAAKAAVAKPKVEIAPEKHKPKLEVKEKPKVEVKPKVDTADHADQHTKLEADVNNTLSSLDKLKARDAAKKSKAYKHLIKLGAACTTSKLQAGKGILQLTFEDRLKNGKPEVYQLKLTGHLTLASNEDKVPATNISAGKFASFDAEDEASLEEQATARFESMMSTLVKHLKKQRDVAESYIGFFYKQTNAVLQEAKVRYVLELKESTTSLGYFHSSRKEPVDTIIKASKFSSYQQALDEATLNNQQLNPKANTFFYVVPI